MRTDLRTGASPSAARRGRERPETPHSTAQRRAFTSTPGFLDGPLFRQRAGGYVVVFFLFEQVSENRKAMREAEEPSLPRVANVTFAIVTQE